MAQVYKTFTKVDLANKAVVPTTTAQNQKITATLAKFVELFKLKHL